MGHIVERLHQGRCRTMQMSQDAEAAHSARLKGSFGEEQGFRVSCHMWKEVTGLERKYFQSFYGCSPLGTFYE